MDELTELMGETQVDTAALGEHPRFSQYKNEGRAAEQQAERRRQQLDRQSRGRDDIFNRGRNLTADADEAVEEPMDLTVRKKNSNKFADRLMLSEWLIDIPEELSSQWTMVPSPVGTRVLVVASRGVTTVYKKNGRMVTQFASSLPGGGPKASKHGCAILDCIQLHDKKTYYCLDLLEYDRTDFSESPFSLRYFMLTSKLAEMTNFGPISFKSLPACSCDKASMEKMLSEPFEFEADGLLFYYSECLYEAGSSALVGWLKPWMMPEILGVPINPCYSKKDAKFEKSKDFIDHFNSKCQSYKKKPAEDQPTGAKENMNVE